MGKSHQMVRGLHWAILFAATMLFSTAVTDAFSPRQIATCGASIGYGYYPKAGLRAFSDEAGKWAKDSIRSGKFTLTETSEKPEFDLLVTDAIGRVFSSKQDGAIVLLTGAAKHSISVVVAYPDKTVTETYTFSEMLQAMPKRFGPVIKVVGHQS